ncbi:hypothetical protein HNP77_001164 [Treponema rectale]|uniref:Serine aminopeptidase S33 domain-containing protein n=1 Tax=Treponema rectale TaxID=744512 RepID=A0A840SDG0_9SPIR|nr:alpha/beta fold hydrolase [Treponema rectale]MBB5218795.1 hypothetical protein [Treponema rectale]
MKKSLKIFIPVISFFLIIILSLFLAANYLLKEALSPVHPNDAPDSDYYIGQPEKPAPDPSDTVETAAYNSFNASYAWLKENSIKCSTQSFDGLKLNAYLAKQKDECHNYIITVHGWKSKPKNISSYAEHFYQNKFNVLVPGMRGHGWSDGDFIDMGYFCKYDIKEWCSYITQNDPEARIALWGISMGGTTVMLTTGLELPQNILCAVEDCGYASAWDQLCYRLKIEYNLPAFPLMNMADSFIKSKYNFSLKDVDCLEALKKSRTPILFIHGLKDDFVPPDNLQRCYDAAACEKKLLEIPEAVHARSVFTDSEKYWSTVDAFLNKYFFPQEEITE